MSGSAERNQLMSVHVDPVGIVRLTWARGIRVTGPLAQNAMDLVDEINAERPRPLLVDMAGTAVLTREARAAFSRKCSASKIALVGQSAVDRVIANFVLGVSSVPVPTRFFTSHPAAVAWLRNPDTDP